MLILTRRIGESVIIGDKTVVFSVLGVKGSQVRLGIEASKDISVHREEIYDRIQQEKMQETDATPESLFNEVESEADFVASA